MERIFGYARLLATGAPAPLASITVYDKGTLTPITIYDDNLQSPTVKANPFAADQNGFFYFYAANDRVDVRFSDGGIVTPYTWGDVQLLDAYPLDWVNVKDPLYGAVGDGTTDDTAAIQAALNAAVPTNCGKVVYFPAGIYRTTATLLPQAETLLLGAGKTASFIRYTPVTTGAKVVFANDVRRVCMRDLAVQCNGNSQICVELYRDDEFTVINCAFFSLIQGSGTGARVRSLVNGYTGMFSGCSFENLARGTQIGLNTDGPPGTDGGADNVSFISCKFSSNVIGAYADHGNQILFVGCRFENNSTYGLTNSGLCSTSFITCVGCWFENNTTRHFFYDNTFASECAFINCLFAAGTGDIGTNTTNYFLGTYCDPVTGPQSGYGLKGRFGYHRVSDGQTFGNPFFRTKQNAIATTPNLGTTAPMAIGNIAPYAWVDCLAPDGTVCVMPIWKLA